MDIRALLYLSAQAIRRNKLRSSLTMAIIAFGIMAIVGIFTAIGSIQSSMYDNFVAIGSNGFTIQSWALNIQFKKEGVKKQSIKDAGEKKKSARSNETISFRQAEQFKKEFNYPAKVSLSVNGNNMATVFFKDKKTDPNVRIIGGDENYLPLNGYNLLAGRNFNEEELHSGKNVAILGHDVAGKLLGKEINLKNPLKIRIGTARYEVIGILQAKGNSNLFSSDNLIITSINNVRRVFQPVNPSFQIGVQVPQVEQVNEAIGEASGVFRNVRKLGLKEADNFYIQRNDNIVHVLMNSLGKVKIAAIFIGFVTLFGSAIGLMNIMLVAVAERTREIGITKALGAKNNGIRRQFLYESVMISLLGGIAGIILGILVGNLVSILMKTKFIIPWGMIILGIFICTLVGIFSGLLPAVKAAKLNPITALRYE